MALENQTWQPWDGDLTTLREIEPFILDKTNQLTLWQGKLTDFAGGKIYIYAGYRLTTGEIVYQTQPFDITINSIH
jgi:hypothetical protein